MKSFIIYLLIKTLVSLDRKVVIEYARKWCNNYNPVYIKYADEGEAGNFASQCLYEGGESFSGCAGKDTRGMIPNFNNFFKCLEQKGWKNSDLVNTKASEVKPGYIVNHKRRYNPMIVTGYKGEKITVCQHDTNRCDEEIDLNNLIYYYKE